MFLIAGKQLQSLETALSQITGNVSQEDTKARNKQQRVPGNNGDVQMSLSSVKGIADRMIGQVKNDGQAKHGQNEYVQQLGIRFHRAIVFKVRFGSNLKLKTGAL